MLHILLLILKIIGIIIAVILGILIVLLGVVLFVPVRYEVKASFDGKISTAKAMAEATWFARLFGVNIQYTNKKLRWRVRIAWKNIMASENDDAEPTAPEMLELDEGMSEGIKEEKGKVKADEKKTKPEKNLRDDKERMEEDEKSEEKSVDTKAEETVQKDEKKLSEMAVEERKDVPQKVEKPEKELEEERKESKEADVKKRLGIVEKLQNIYHKIVQTKNHFCDKIKALSEKKDKVMEFLQNESHKKAWAKLKKEAWKLLKRLWPKKVKADIRYGFEDPSITGKILAGFSMVYPFVGESVHVYPDFEQSIIEGKLYIKGNVRVITFIRTAWNLLWCKAVRKTYHDIREFM